MDAAALLCGALLLLLLQTPIQLARNLSVTLSWR